MDCSSAELRAWPYTRTESMLPVKVEPLVRSAPMMRSPSAGVCNAETPDVADWPFTEIVMLPAPSYTSAAKVQTFSGRARELWKSSQPDQKYASPFCRPSPKLRPVQLPVLLETRASGIWSMVG